MRFAQILSAGPVLASALLSPACSSGDTGESGAGGTTSAGSSGASSGGTSVPAGGSSGNGAVAFGGGGMLASSGSGGVAFGGAPASGASGSGGTVVEEGGGSGAAGSSSAGGGFSGSGGSGGGGGNGTGPFVCNQLTGGKLTEEWFIAGFEKVVDNARWQVKWREDAYVEVWADAQSSFWTAQVDSVCTRSSSVPDRLVFGAVSFKYKTRAEWRTGITQAVNNFKVKWPSLRRVDLVTQIRGPNNMLCPTAPIPGETIAVPAEQDGGMADVAADFPGFVFVAPKVEAHSCSDFQGGGPHLTAAGNMANVSVLSDYFVQAQ